jgi:2',3'-cyclic-nucleotide 2'-phosphodiesterase (5'-nucleotidase family)
VTLIRRVRQRAPDALLLDAGDSLIRDRTPATTSQGASSVELLNAMGYDAMALGEGDLGLLGVDRLGQLLGEAQFVMLSANVVLSDTTVPTGTNAELVLPYEIRQVQGYAVALIGLTGPSASHEVTVLDPIESVRQVVEQASQEASVLILLSHVGITANIQIASQVPEIDLIVSGGGKGYTPQPFLTDGGPPIVHADMPSPIGAGRRVGVGTWWFDEQGRLVGHDWQFVPLTPDIADDIEMSRWMRDNP